MNFSGLAGDGGVVLKEGAGADFEDDFSAIDVENAVDIELGTGADAGEGGVAKLGESFGFELGGVAGDFHLATVDELLGGAGLGRELAGVLLSFAGDDEVAEVCFEVVAEGWEIDCAAVDLDFGTSADRCDGAWGINGDAFQTVDFFVGIDDGRGDADICRSTDAEGGAGDGASADVILLVFRIEASPGGEGGGGAGAGLDEDSIRGEGGTRADVEFAVVGEVAGGAESGAFDQTEGAAVGGDVLEGTKRAGMGSAQGDLGGSATGEDVGGAFLGNDDGNGGETIERLGVDGAGSGGSRYR